MFVRVLYTIARGAFAFLFALFITRILGRKLISQMTFFDFVVGVTMGSLAANLSIGSDTTAPTAAIALATFAALGIASGFIDIKSLKARKLMDSEPVTLIDKGNIVEDNMKRIRLTIDELNMKLREKNIFSMADVEFAIMETDGQVSVLPKADKVPLTPKHINIPTASSGLMKDIILDGNIMDENLRSAGLDRQWLEIKLKEQGIQKETEVFYAGVDNLQNLYISKKNAGNTEGHGKYGIE